MKITKSLAIAALLSLSASTVFAAVTTLNDTGTTTVGSPVCTIKPSKNVTLYYNSAVTTGQGLGAYSMQSIHSSGSKTFGSSSGDTKIFMKDGTTYGAVDAPGVGGTANFSAWTAM